MKGREQYYDLVATRRKAGNGSPERLPVLIPLGHGVSFFLDRNDSDKVVGAFAHDMLDRTHRGRVDERTPAAVIRRFKLECRLRRLKT